MRKIKTFIGWVRRGFRKPKRKPVTVSRDEIMAYVMETPKLKKLYDKKIKAINNDVKYQERTIKRRKKKNKTAKASRKNNR